MLEGMSMVSTASTTGGGTVVDISGDGGVTREMIREGDGKGLATGDIAMVRFTGTVEETGQVSRESCRALVGTEGNTCSQQKQGE